MRIPWNNLAENATLTESSFLSGYPISNVQIPQLARLFKFDGNSGNIVLDFGAAVNIKSIVIGNTNMTSSGTLTIEANATDSWGGPSYQQAITVNDDTANQALFLDETYRYFRIVFSDATLTDIEVGHLSFGDYLQIDAWNLDRKNYLNTAKDSITGTRQLYGKAGINYRSWAINVYMQDSDFANFVTMAETNQGIDPVWVFLYEGDFDDYPPVFAKLNIGLLEVEEQYISNDNYFSFTIEEVN